MVTLTRVQEGTGKGVPGGALPNPAWRGERGLGQVENKESRGDDPRTYRMDFTAKAGPISCPVEACSGRAATCTATRLQFWHRHIQDTVVILEESNLPHPR